MEDYRVDAGFVERVKELVAGRSGEEVWAITRIHPNQLRDILKGKISQPTFNMLVRLTRLQGWATPTWVALGHNENEEPVETLAKLHDWDVRMAKQRMRYFEAILARQQTGLSPEQAELAEDVDAAAQEMQERADTPGLSGPDDPEATPPGREGTAA